MADNNRRVGDVIDVRVVNFHQNEGTAAKASSTTDTDLLRSINNTLDLILRNTNSMSQSAARGSMPGDRREANKWSTDRTFRRIRGGRSGLGSFDNVMDGFTEGLEKALLESIGASEFKAQLKSGLSGLAEELGVTLDEVPETLGKELGKELTKSGIGKSVSDGIKNHINRAMSGVADAYKSGQSASSMRDAFGKGVSSIFGKSVNRQAATSSESQDLKDALNNVAEAMEQATESRSAGSVKFDSNKASSRTGDNFKSAVGDIAEEGLSTGIKGAKNAMASGATKGAAMKAGASGALKGIAAAAGKVIPQFLIVAAALAALDHLLDKLGVTVEGVKAVFDAAGNAMSRNYKTSQKNTELAKKRMESDVNAMVEAPFKILESAAQNLYDAWDNQIRMISATQGYYKEDVQSLMASYAERLRDEGLSKVVSGANIVENLSKVLESGLSGQVAEEFAYLATKLNAAIPSQDFFAYGSTYASVAANAIKNGYSQAEAIAYANAEMEAFASNVLYAGRQLSGGFSTGLKDAQNLFDYSVQIANASKTGDPSNISGVLTSVSAITGAIAPDLASGIVEAVVKAATGGNASDIVALRSLAGINASNTEFLRTLAENPQQVFTGLFTNLASMQNMSNDNFMEVAEGLSSVFGISMDAFARVDFNYLANAISQMNVNNASLSENMELLASGQTTATAEQLKMAQINEYMIEEGLAYVLDNEVARQIQQHMWDEQLAREMTEATYAVELQGAGLQFLEGLKHGLETISNFLNPFAAAKAIANIVYSGQEREGLNSDIKQILELGKVGQGNTQSMYNLTTSNKSLGLTSTMVELMGGSSQYADASSRRKQWMRNADALQGIFTPGVSTLNFGIKEVGRVKDAWQSGQLLGSSGSSNIASSKYTWANISKSTANALMSSLSSSGLTITGKSTDSLASAVVNKSNSTFENFLSTMESAVSDNKSYEEWAATASSHGIKDLKAAIADYGTTEEALRGKFGQNEAKKASEYNAERRNKEDEYWKQATMFATNTQEGWLKYETLISDNQSLMIAELTTANAKLADIHNKEKEFLNAWTSYYIDNAAYSKSTISAYRAAEILNSEKKESGDAVLALAQALTANTIGITEGFKDPVVQTNVLLAKILLVAESIMQQNNKTGQLTIPDSLAAIATGMFGESR